MGTPDEQDPATGRGSADRERTDREAANRERAGRGRAADAPARAGRERREPDTRPAVGAAMEDALEEAGRSPEDLTGE